MGLALVPRNEIAAGPADAIGNGMTNIESNARQIEIKKAQTRRDEAAQRLSYEAGFKCDIGAAMQEFKAADEALNRIAEAK